MSKGSEFWGNASGKLGQQVLYRAGGEQRARMHVAKIKNPRTLAQMKNRILMNNVVSAFHGLKPLLQATFPNRKSNQSAFNAFVKANKQMNQYYIGKEEVESTACVPYGMQIGKGNLGITIKPTMKKVTDFRDPELAPRVFYAVEGLLNLEGLEMEVAGEDTYSGVYYPTLEELFAIFSERCIVQLPSEFSISVIASEYAADDEDPNSDIWQFGYIIKHLQQFNSYERRYGIDRNSSLLKIGLQLASYEAVGSNGKAKVTFSNILLGNGAVTANDNVKRCLGMVLSFKDASGQQVVNSYMSSIPKKFEGEKVNNPAEDYEWGGFVCMQVLDEYGYKANDVLTSEALNIGAVEEEEEEGGGGEDLTD